MTQLHLENALQAATTAQRDLERAKLLIRDTLQAAVNAGKLFVREDAQYTKHPGRPVAALGTIWVHENGGGVYCFFLRRDKQIGLRDYGHQLSTLEIRP